MNQNESLQSQFNRIPSRALIVGVAVLVVCVIGAVFSRAQFFRAYLFAYLFWWGISIGCLAVLALHHLVSGQWGYAIQRVLEAGTRTLPLMAVLFIPVLVGLVLGDLYIWAIPDEVATDPILQHKRPYLNIPFFIIRAITYFAIWSGLAFVLNRWSLRHDAGELHLKRRLQLFSAGGLLLYCATVTFASIDWGMSLEPHWFSTIYGVIFIIGNALSTLAFSIVAISLFADRKSVSGVITANHFHDLGNLLLAFVMLWAYIELSQFLIVWSGNLPEEIPWYLHRTRGGWEWIGRILILFHFVVPFLLLLSRWAKRRVSVISKIALAIVFMRLVDIFWMIAPAFHEGVFQIHWLDILAPLGIGGIWLWGFTRQLGKYPLVSPHLQKPNGEGHHGAA